MKFLYLLVFVSSLSGLRGQSQNISENPASGDKFIQLSETGVDSAISLGLQFLGTPYRYGGNSPTSGFDCSGFIHYVFKHLDITLPRSSRGYASIGEKIAREEIQPGDVLLFKGRNHQSSIIGHVALVVEVKDNLITMLHASTSRGVVLETMEAIDYYMRRFLMARRIFQD
jgi:cell wall-associated NlpC family hydrolase